MVVSGYSILRNRRSPIREEVRRGEEERPAAHDKHARGDVGGLGRARPPSEVRHGDDRQQGAEVVGALYMTIQVGRPQNGNTYVGGYSL